ncbi:AroM family protein [Ruania alba]|uniref:Protein AroM n=1 Tax=Ruania alba TaxID=648782 RepID=A0A1H5NFM9_9MICO|nr:AroM family protein [Ruania alba]SEF00413.1 protein AroM [Ruania alba]
MTARLGMVTIGQSPRVDLTGDIADVLTVPTLEHGALDGLDAAAIARLAPSPGEPVLTSRLADGSSVVLTHRRLMPHLRTAVQRCVDDGARAVLVLCTGDLDHVDASVPVLHAEALAHAAVAGLLGDGADGPRLGVVSPLPDQSEASAARWHRALGREVLVTAANPYTDSAEVVGAAADRLAAAGADWVFLDCIGYTEAMRRGARSGVRVLLARSIAARLAVEAVTA